ncbi:MAG: T9SS type A sorting domain-containing protein [Bacteroides sp.]|nr:T9SS type A sorting domain-containing protein [Ruminococcus flavefaciens]MCM1554839.1 T9SS type A sorting domain-containing protein [Bacteroides sp.]
MKRLLIGFFLAIFTIGVSCQSVQAQCHNQYERGSIIGDSSCISADDQAIHTYRYVFPASIDTGDVIGSGWSAYGALEVVEQGYDFIRVRSTDTGLASLAFSYRLRSDQNKACVKSGCVSYSYYARFGINKIYSSRFVPVIEGNPLVSEGEKSTFWVSGLLSNASITWTAPSYMKMVKSSSNREYVTYDVSSAPRAGDTLSVRMNLACNSGLVGKMALSVGTEAPEIEEVDVLACVPLTQDSVSLSVKNPRKGYLYWWECWNENWEVLPSDNGEKAVLYFTGEEKQGTVVLYATNGFGIDTAYTPYKVVRCNKTCSYDTNRGIDISQAKCLKPGETAVFRINADPDAVSYTWEFGGGWSPETHTTTDPNDTVVRVLVGEANGWVRVTGENCSGEWHMEVSDSIPVVTYEAELAHYDGCVNIGLPDTLQLRVENIREGNAYLWDLPENWIPVGCDTCGEITVAVQESIDITRSYRVSGVPACPKFVSYDTVFVRGADTTLIILDDGYTYCATPRILDYVDEDVFEFLWYKKYCHPDNVVDFYVVTDQYLFDGEPPVLAYRYDHGCWTVTNEVVEWTEDMEFASFSTKPTTLNRKNKIEPTIQMFPNPTGNQVVVRWNIDIDKIELLSENGQRQQFFTMSGLKQKTLNLYSLPSGVYFVRFINEGSVLATKKLVKR